MGKQKNRGNTAVSVEKYHWDYYRRLQTTQGITWTT